MVLPLPGRGQDPWVLKRSGATPGAARKGRRRLVAGRVHHPRLRGETHLEEVRELVAEQLLELGLLQLVLVALPPGVLVENADEGHHGLLQLGHPGPRGDTRLLTPPAPPSTAGRARRPSRARAGHRGNPAAVALHPSTPRPPSAPPCRPRPYRPGLRLPVGFGRWETSKTGRSGEGLRAPGCAVPHGAVTPRPAGDSAEPEEHRHRRCSDAPSNTWGPGGGGGRDPGPPQHTCASKQPRAVRVPPRGLRIMKCGNCFPLN